MLVELQKDDLFHRTSLVAHPEDYDGFPPVSQFCIEWVGAKRESVDRLAAAAVTAFYPWVSGRLSVGGDLSQPMAGAIELFLGDRDVRAEHVTLRPREPVRGTGALVLGEVDGFKPLIEWRGFDDARQTALLDCPASERAGASFSTKEIVVPSNASMLRLTQERSRLEYWFPNISVAIMLAGSFGVGEVWLPAFLKDSCLLPALRDLLKAADLAVCFSTGNIE